jgi:hypothetical protein
VAVLPLAVLHFISDEADPAGIVARFAAELAPGSLIAISHLTGDFAPQEITDSAKVYNARVPMQVYPRSREQVTALCGDLRIEYPGVVPVNHWMPSLRETPGSALDLHAAVIRLPRPEPAPGSVASQARSVPLGTAGEAAALEQAAARFPGHRILRENTGAGVAYLAHVYGFLAGVLVALLAKPSVARPEVATEPWRRGY